MDLLTPDVLTLPANLENTVSRSEIVNLMVDTAITEAQARIKDLSDRAEALRSGFEAVAKQEAEAAKTRIEAAAAVVLAPWVQVMSDLGITGKLAVLPRRSERDTLITLLNAIIYCKAANVANPDDRMQGMNSNVVVAALTAYCERDDVFMTFAFSKLGLGEKYADALDPKVIETLKALNAQRNEVMSEADRLSLLIADVPSLQRRALAAMTLQALQGSTLKVPVLQLTATP